MFNVFEEKKDPIEGGVYRVKLLFLYNPAHKLFELDIFGNKPVWNLMNNDIWSDDLFVVYKSGSVYEIVTNQKFNFYPRWDSILQPLIYASSVAWESDLDKELHERICVSELCYRVNQNNQIDEYMRKYSDVEAWRNKINEVIETRIELQKRVIKSGKEESQKIQERTRNLGDKN